MSTAVGIMNLQVKSVNKIHSEEFVMSENQQSEIVQESHPRPKQKNFFC